MQIPSIPDNIYKIFLSISIVILFYCVIEMKDSQNNLRSYILGARKELNEKLAINGDLKALKRQILWVSGDLSTRYGIEPFVFVEDSTVVYRNLIDLTPLEDSLFSEIRPLIIDYEGMLSRGLEIAEVSDSELRIMSIMTESYSKYDTYIMGLSIIGSILFLYSAIKLAVRSDMIDKILLKSRDSEDLKKNPE